MNGLNLNPCLQGTIDKSIVDTTELISKIIFNEKVNINSINGGQVLSAIDKFISVFTLIISKLQIAKLNILDNKSENQKLYVEIPFQFKHCISQLLYNINEINIPESIVNSVKNNISTEEKIVIKVDNQTTMNQIIEIAIYITNLINGNI